jgi:hypothetical protein
MSAPDAEQKFSNQVRGDLNKERKKPGATNIQHISAWDTVRYKKMSEGFPD